MTHILCLVIILMTAVQAAARDSFKYTDQNGIDFWLEDKSKIPPPYPQYYRYEDRNGVVSWVNDIGKIPEEYRNQPQHGRKPGRKESPGGGNPAETKKYATRISIQNNQIIVPVTFKNKGRKVKAKMILDTGASVTTLYSVLAGDLRLRKNKSKKVRSISAHGTSAESLLTKVDYVEVDGKILANSEVMILPAHSNIGADGLLGNSFLRFFNFTIDYENQLLRWN